MGNFMGTTNFAIRNWRKSAISPMIMAEDAVSSEPVSGTNSLVTGKNTGNFTILPL
jgi:hypothetical protein